MKIPYTDETKQAIITTQKAKGWFLIEEQLHSDGKFLVFDNTPNPGLPVPTLADAIKRIEALEAKMTIKEG